MLAFPMGLATVCGPSDSCTIACVDFQKEVGYVSAPNWVWNSILVLPCLAFFLTAARQSIPSTLQALGSKGMLVDSSGAPVSAQVAIEDWQRFLKRSAPIFALLIVVAIAEPLVEWAATSAWPLLSGQLKLTAENEFDWSVAALLRQQGFFSKISNVAFSLFVFGIQSLMITAYALLIFLSFGFSYFFQQRRASWQIVPDPKDSDPRKGFQVFEEPISHLFVCAILALCMLYLSILQNNYLRTDHESFPTFVHQDIVAGIIFMSPDEDVTNANISLLNPNPSRLRSCSLLSEFNPATINFSQTFTSIGGFVVLAIVLGIPLWILRAVALRGNEALSSLQRGETLKIEVWPLRYISINGYLLVCVIAALSLMIYRVGLFFFGIFFATAIARVAGVLMKKIKSSN